MSIFYFLLLTALFSGVGLEASANSIEISARVAGCGDGMIDAGELCDSANLGGASCQSLGFESGTLSCTSACMFNTLSCFAGDGGSNASRSSAVRTPDEASVPAGVSSAIDFNTDGTVNLADFSIMAYWYGRSPVPERVDLNNDSKLDLVDFSIMAFHWSR